MACYAKGSNYKALIWQRNFRTWEKFCLDTSLARPEENEVDNTGDNNGDDTSENVVENTADDNASDDDNDSSVDQNDSDPTARKF